MGHNLAAYLSLLTLGTETETWLLRGVDCDEVRSRPSAFRTHSGQLCTVALTSLASRFIHPFSSIGTSLRGGKGFHPEPGIGQRVNKKVNHGHLATIIRGYLCSRAGISVRTVPLNDRAATVFAIS